MEMDNNYKWTIFRSMVWNVHDSTKTQSKQPSQTFFVPKETRINVNIIVKPRW